MSEESIKIQTVLSQPFAENTYIAYFASRGDCLVVDPGLEPEKILAQLESLNLTPAAILNTHGHADHIAGNGLMKEHCPDCPLVIGTGDAPKLTDPNLNLSAPFGMELISPEADVLLDHGQSYRAAGFELEVLETPGHSSGHIVFVCKDQSPWLVFGGDVLFRDGIGRYDFPGCSFEQLNESIQTKMFTLPDDTIVLPGHGPSTTIGYEKQNNPFVGRRSSGAI